MSLPKTYHGDLHSGNVKWYSFTVDRDCHAGAPLQGTKVIGEFGLRIGLVFVEAVKSNQGMKNEQQRAMELHGGDEFFAVLCAIETQRVNGDVAHVDVVELRLVVTVNACRRACSAGMGSSAA